MSEMIGKRISGMSELDEESVCYWKVDDGSWLLYIPHCGIGGLKKHTIEEHDDGTISVTPSIVMFCNRCTPDRHIHGYLTNGIWKPI